MSRRVRNTTLQNAVKLMEDHSFLKKTTAFYRNGKTGHLHANRHCWKLTYNPDVLHLTWEEALTRRACTTGCVQSSIPERATVSRAVELHRNNRLLDSAQDWLAQGDRDGIGSAMTTIASVRRELIRMDSEGIYPAHSKALERAEELGRVAAVTCTENSDATLREVAADLTIVQRGQELLEPNTERVVRTGKVLGCTQGMAARAGNIAYASRPAVDDAYKSWRGKRPTESAEAAVAAAHETLDLVNLNMLEQLDGVALTNANGDALASVVDAWTKQVEHDFAELTETWETLYQANVLLTEPTLVGVDLKSMWRQDSEEIAVLRAFPHHETPTVLVGVYPLVAVYWLYGHMDVRDNLLQSASGNNVDGELLHTVATLWNPVGAKGDCYTSLDRALEAARVL